jgi:hypothetical protein
MRNRKKQNTKKNPKKRRKHFFIFYRKNVFISFFYKNILNRKFSFLLKMPILLCVEKNGDMKEINIKDYKPEELYKKAGFKNGSGFECRHIFHTKQLNIAMYGKLEGKAGQENKYEFPPPIDSALFFGSCLLLKCVSSTDPTMIGNLTLDEWETFYEECFEGFDDLNSEEEDEEEEEIDEELKTAQGYEKDGFVVDDEEFVEEEEESEEEIIVPKKKKISKPKMMKMKKEPELFVNTAELEEESYFV